jgi:hypothetical protein
MRQTSVRSIAYPLGRTDDLISRTFYMCEVVVELRTKLDSELESNGAWARELLNKALELHAYAYYHRRGPRTSNASISADLQSPDKPLLDGPRKLCESSFPRQLISGRCRGC